MAGGIYDKMLEEYHKERKTDAFFKTQGYKKLWNYVQVVIDGKEFQTMVVTMRKQYEIPPNGFLLEGAGPWSHPPKEWKYYGHREFEEIRKILSGFLITRELLPKDWLYTFESYLLYNRPFADKEPGKRNLCFVSDGIKNVDGVGGIVEEDAKKIYPVLLHISPYASKRDILDYVELVYKPEIERMQEQYKNPEIDIGKYRTRKVSIQKRNSLILKNKAKSNKRIGALAREQSPQKPLKNSSIGKTLSREKRRRG
jgi:hypothetical protein